MMKSIILLLILGSGAAYSQDSAYYSASFLKDKAMTNAREYLAKYFNEYDLRHHVKLKKNETRLFLKTEFKKRKLDSIAMHWVEGYRLTYAFETASYSSEFTLVLRSNFEVVEKIDYINHVNFDELFFQAHQDYLKQMKDGKILHADSVLHFVNQRYPEKKWSQPKISRMSSPPYQFYYEVFESGCNPCEEVMIDLVELKELKRSSFDMIPE